VGVTRQAGVKKIPPIFVEIGGINIPRNFIEIVSDKFYPENPGYFLSK